MNLPREIPAAGARRRAFDAPCTIAGLTALTERPDGLEYFVDRHVRRPHDSRFVSILTVNLPDGSGPFWHASVGFRAPYPPHGPVKRRTWGKAVIATGQQLAKDLLAGVGVPSADTWGDDEQSLHLTRPLTRREIDSLVASRVG